MSVLRRFAILPAILCMALLMFTPATVLASRPNSHTKSSNKSTVPSPSTGVDISWPQCSRLQSLPAGQAFAIVGVNGGRANTGNPCFASELAWANKSTGKTAQPKVSVYVNTGNPGGTTPVTADWPTTNIDIIDPRFADIDPYGACTGANDTACAWQYGYNMAHIDVSTRGAPNPLSYRWYLDVETSNTWSTNMTNNAADLEGMVAYFKSVSITVGVYSTSRQWKIIVGNYGSSPDAGGNNLNGLLSWLPGADNATDAQLYCKQPLITAGGRVSMAQYTPGDLDYDVSCP